MMKTDFAGPVLAVVITLGAALFFLPRGLEAGWLLLVQDDPVALADEAARRTLSAATVASAIEAALKADDSDLAASLLELAREHGVRVSRTLADQVRSARSAAATASRQMGNFAYGLLTGESEDLAGLAGTMVGDLLVFGDIRDVVREGVRLANGEAADEVTLGLAGVGLAVTGASYASLGAGAPLRIGLSVVKRAHKAGQLRGPLTQWLAQSVRTFMDMPALGRAFARAALAEPAVAMRAVRDAVKVEKARALLHFVGDIGRVQASAGTRAALDSLKIAEGPQDLNRLARVAQAKGSKTRAILKLAGRAAIVLPAALFELASSLFAALFTLLGFCSAVKSTVERATLRYVRWRKARRAGLLAAAKIPG